MYDSIKIFLWNQFLLVVYEVVKKLFLHLLFLAIALYDCYVNHVLKFPEFLLSLTHFSRDVTPQWSWFLFLLNFLYGCDFLIFKNFPTHLDHAKLLFNLYHFLKLVHACKLLRVDPTLIRKPLDLISYLLLVRNRGFCVNDNVAIVIGKVTFPKSARSWHTRLRVCLFEEARFVWRGWLRSVVFVLSIQLRLDDFYHSIILF